MSKLFERAAISTNTQQYTYISQLHFQDKIIGNTFFVQLDTLEQLPFFNVNSMVYSTIEQKLSSLKRLFPHNLTILIEKPKKRRIKTRKIIHVSYQLLQRSTWNATPNTLSTIGKKDTCAVIGNSGILLSSSCGQEIDSHDFVMRSNLAPIKGFENDVGTKTDFASVNGELATIALACFNNESDKCHKEMLNRFADYKTSILWLSKLGRYRKRTYLGVISQLYKHNIRSKIAYPYRHIGAEIVSFWNITSPSSGLFLYTVAASLCKTVSLYGFYPFHKSPNGRELKHHYFEERTMNYSTLHRMPEEFKMFTILHKAGFINLVTDSCLQNTSHLQN
ncbi:CMP-N-acetylneuraminate-poly-alpha-2,8-sialyltransferase-like [Antedon mediterranea]|uniref:CMP-N-acetylneuraminate-poly-alpha-2, 8-sialyltransferase-like n=1 Tax=Antedon mediterranea TaxID=105859 RepID=UPI003AF8F6A9